MAAITAIMVAILTAIFNMVAKIFKMATKINKISKCSNFNKNWYVGFFLHEECDSDKSDLKMASYLRLIL